MKQSKIKQARFTAVARDKGDIKKVPLSLEPRWLYKYAFFLLAYNAWLWTMQVRLTQREPLSKAYIINGIALTFLAIAPVFYTVRTRCRPLLIGLYLVYSLSVLMLYFTYFYWSYGTAHNFNVPLSHLDAFYFSIGTLTTSGTGSIVATSEISRGFQTAQMILDFIFVFFVIGLAVAHFSSRLSVKRP